MPRPTRLPYRGVALIWVVVFLMVLLGFIGLAVDTAYMVLVHHQLQNAADASALAGARYVRIDQTRARARAASMGLANYAGTAADGARQHLMFDLNTSNAPDGDIVLGRYHRASKTFTVTTTMPNAVKSVARRTGASTNAAQSLFFGPIFGTNTADGTREAIAHVVSGSGAALLVLDPTGSCALQLQGNPTLLVQDGPIQVNSNHPNAVCVGGSATMIADELNVVGNTTFQSSTFNVNTGVPVIPDPLAHLQGLSPQGLSNWSAVDETDPGTVTLYPGYYPRGIRLNNNNNNVQCMPGLYVIGTPGPPNQTNHGLYLSGGSFTAHECFFYIAAGPVYFTANATIDISAQPVDEGHYYEHVAIFQSRTNFAEATIIGDNSTNIDGTIYFPNNQLNLTGNSDDFGVHAIAFRVNLQGNNATSIFYDGWGSPGASNRLMLVE